MATKKAASTKKATVKKPAAAKTTVRTVRADAKPATAAPKTVARPVARETGSKLPSNIVNIVFAELVGTFVLTLVALATFQETGALYVGLALTLLVMAIGAVSGSHVNPAVTFGLWSMRRLKSILLPFYWGAQFLGAMLAVIVINLVSHNSLSLNFGHFISMDWTIFAAELVGVAVFIFGLAAATSRRDLSTGTRAVGVGLALMIGLVAGTTLYTATRSAEITSYQAAYLDAQQSGSKDTPAIPHVAYVKGVTLNPAVALAVTDRTDSELNSSTGTSTTKETVYSRFSLEVVLGTLVGAALGGNLYLLVAGRQKND